MAAQSQLSLISSRRPERILYDFAAPEWAVGYHEDRRGRRTPFIVTVVLGLRLTDYARFPDGYDLVWDSQTGAWNFDDQVPVAVTSARFAGALNAGSVYTESVPGGRGQVEIGRLDWAAPLLRERWPGI